MKKRGDLLMSPKKIPKLMFRMLIDAVILLLGNLVKEDSDPWESRKKY